MTDVVAAGSDPTHLSTHAAGVAASVAEPVGRERFPGRRASINIETHHEFSNGNRQRLIVTCGYVIVGGEYKVREVFTASLKPGGDTNAIIADACVHVSMLMQHGYTAKLLSEKGSQPRSLLGTVILAAAQAETELNSPEVTERGN